jgi:ATP-dependent RNA helicase DeaD
LEIPSGKDVCRKQFFAFMDKIIHTTINDASYETYVPLLMEKFADMTKEDILKRVAAMEFDRFLKYYETAEDLNMREKSRSFEKFSREARPERGRDQGRERTQYRDTQGKSFNGGEQYTRLFVNLGTKDGFYKASFLQFVLDMSDLKKEVLGRIDMRELNSWVEVEKKSASRMISSINGKKFKGRNIRMNDAENR